MSVNERIIIDTANYLDLQNAVTAAAEARREIKFQTEAKDQADATISRIALPLLQGRRDLAPGVGFSLLKREIVYDEAKALAFATDPKHAATRAGLLQIREGALASLVALVAEHAPEQLSFLFEIDPVAYLKADEEATYFGLPPITGYTPKWSFRMELKYYDALRFGEGFQILEPLDAEATDGTSA